jgi:beta-lactamase regulating signal transducer with metallopeptidase domain
MSADRLLAWLLTYSVHSTLILGLAWLVAGRLARRSPSAAELVWRIALVGGLVTATIQSFAYRWTPAAGVWPLNPEAAVVRELPAPFGGAELTAWLPAMPARPAREVTSVTSAAPLESLRLSLPAPAQAAAPRPSWRLSSLAVWGLGAALLLLGASRSYWRLRRRLQDRPRVVGGDLHLQLRELAASTGAGAVRLTCSSRVPVPLALGLRRKEICLPPRALVGLTPEQQEAMLAHELAHLQRRDPLWLLVGHAIACLFFFQPLNWVARRRLRELSELLADAWAVERTGRPLSLAGCLAEVAGWAFGTRRLPAAAMADRPSHLARRISRLLDGAHVPAESRRKLALAIGGVFALAIVVAAAPVVCGAGGDESAHPVKCTQAEPAVAHGSPAAAFVLASMQSPKPHHEAEERERAREHEEDAAEADDDSRGDAVEGSVEDAVDDAVDSAMEDSVGGSVEEAVEKAMAEVDSAGDAVGDSLDDVTGDLDEQVESLARDYERMGREGQLSEAQQRELARKLAAQAREMERRLRPQMERLNREIAKQVRTSVEGSAEMKKLAEEMARKAEEMKPSREAIERMRHDAMKMAEEQGALSVEQREKIAAEAKRLAESMKPTAEQLREISELARKQGEEARRVVESHRDEIEAAKREMRQEMEREMEGMRRELERQRGELHGRGREMREKGEADRKRQHEDRDKVRVIERQKRQEIEKEHAKQHEQSLEKRREERAERLKQHADAKKRHADEKRGDDDAEQSDEKPPVR